MAAIEIQAPGTCTGRDVRGPVPCAAPIELDKRNNQYIAVEFALDAVSCMHGPHHS